MGQGITAVTTQVSLEDKRSSKFSISARMRSFRFAFAGLRHLLNTEHNSRIHLAASLIVIAAGAYLRVAIADWCWIVIAVAIVWITEALNTSIEHLADEVTHEHSLGIKAAKDVAASAVLVAASAAVVIGLLVFLPYLLAL
jgi:diacylglycerol kinase (ATP)